MRSSELGAYMALPATAVWLLVGAVSALKLGQRFWPGVIIDLREFVPCEITQNIVLSTLKEQIK